jgi:hypothetical protein
MKLAICLRDGGMIGHYQCSCYYGLARRFSQQALGVPASCSGEATHVAGHPGAGAGDGTR